jgi:hypothetical protein
MMERTLARVTAAGRIFSQKKIDPMSPSGKTPTCLLALTHKTRVVLVSQKKRLTGLPVSLFSIAGSTLSAAHSSSLF